MKKYLILLFSFLLLACGKAKNSDIPIVNLILDTDMGPDYDDVGAMTLMYRPSQIVDKSIFWQPYLPTKMSKQFHVLK